MAKGKEFILALILYVISMTVLLMALYRFMQNWNMDGFNIFVVGMLVFMVAIGWGYVLTALIFAPAKKMESTLTTLTNNIVHELNIPLSTIKANTNMLKKTLKDEKSLIRLERIEDASVRLERLYKELSYTIRKEIHEIEKENFDVKAVVEQRVAFFKEQKRNPFELLLEPYEIQADKIGFEQMLDNILVNAMKYSDKTALIFISLNTGKLCIKDKGIGMSTSELVRVHERYFQGDIENEGEGIGLALVKSYCEDSDIDFHIASEKNSGTQICLTLTKIFYTKSL